MKFGKMRKVEGTVIDGATSGKVGKVLRSWESLKMLEVLGQFAHLKYSSIVMD